MARDMAARPSRPSHAARPSVVLAITYQNGQGLVYRGEDGGRTWGGPLMSEPKVEDRRLNVTAGHGHG